MTPQLSADDNIKKDIKNVDVQLLTQADFDCMSLARQQFIRDRIAAGQIKIVSSEDITPPRPPQQPNSSGDLKKLQRTFRPMGPWFRNLICNYVYGCGGDLFINPPFSFFKCVRFWY